jgi:putative hydrolase of the HAD superfamily
MNASSLRAITLDLDDTLWPVGPTLVAAEGVLNEWLRTHAPATAAATTPESRAAIRKQILLEHPQRSHDLNFLRSEGLRRAMQANGDDPTLADAAFAVFLDARQRVNCFDDVVPVLARWARRYRLVAVTNGNADIARVGLGDYFVGAVNAHEIGCAKPDPRIFHAACQIAGVSPAETLHIGDDPHLDVVAARECGLHAAWLRRPAFAHRHPADALAAHTVAPFEDLHAIDAMLHGPV